MTNGVTVEGADTLARTMHAASDDLADMGRPAGTTARLIANRARVGAPRLTGALAASVRPATDGGTAEVMSALVYANRTHWGYAAVGQRAQPFIADARAQTESQWMGAYQDEAERILHTVKGA